MKKGIKGLVAILSVFITIFSSSCGIIPKSTSEIAGRLIEDGYKVEISKDTLEGEVEIVKATKTISGYTKEVLALVFEKESDYEFVFNKRKEVVSSLFSGKTLDGRYYYEYRGKTLVFSNTKKATEDLKNSSANSKVSNIIKNLLESGYTINATSHKYSLLNFIDSLYYISAKGENGGVEAYLFANKDILKECYEYYLDYYEQKIDEGKMIVKKKGKILIIASSEAAYEDALGW